MANKAYTPTEAATLLGLTAQSIRRYCTRFERHLSEEASPPKGSTRRLTDKDLATLRQVKIWTGAGHTYAEIDDMLDGLSEEELVGSLLPVVAPTTDLAATLHQLLAREEQLQQLEEAQKEQGERLRQLEEAQKRRQQTTEAAVRLVPWLTFTVILLLLAVLLLVLVR